jgi:hypothetical protein
MMRETAEQISNGKVMQAVQNQNRVIASLEAAVSTLGGSSDSDMNVATRAEQLKQAGERISELAELQSSVAGEMSTADSDAARKELAARQDELASATQAVKQQLDALGDQSGSRVLQAALEAQAEAESALEQSENQRAAESAKRAAEELERAANSAKDRSQRLDEQDRQDRKFELLESLQVLVAEQQQIETQLRQAAPQVAGTSSSDADREVEPTSARLSAIADRQRDAEQSLAAVRQSAGGMQADQAQARSDASNEAQAASFQVFRWTLEQASLDMTRTAAAAERMRVDPEAIDAAGAALAKLRMALEAIDAEPSQRSPEIAPQSDSQRPEEQDEQGGNLIPPLATLKLLRSLQTNINERTKNLDEAELARPLRNQLLSELTRQQQEIGKQLETWVQRMAASRAARGN